MPQVLQYKQDFDGDAMLIEITDLKISILKNFFLSKQSISSPLSSNLKYFLNIELV